MNCKISTHWLFPSVAIHVGLISRKQLFEGFNGASVVGTNRNVMINVAFEDNGRVPVNFLGLDNVDIEKVLLLAEFWFLYLNLTLEEELKSVFLFGIDEYADYRDA